MDPVAAGRDPRREACDALARRLVTPEGVDAATLREITTNATADDAPLEPTADAAAETIAARYLGDSAAPIGIWKPQIHDDEVVFVRDPDAATSDWWPPHERLVAKRSLLPLRVVLLGESTAAGWFYAPALTPAAVLAAQLDATRGPGVYEVLDLTQVNQQAGDLVDLTGAALQLTPDVLIVFAGNNWPSRLPSFPGATAADGAQAADALRAAGMPALRRQADDATRQQVADVLEIIARLADAGDASLVVVVPEVNAAAWPRDRPVPWLPGDAAGRWHAAHAEVLAARRAGAWPAAADAARAMLVLDGGVSATSHRLLGDALAALGRLDDASAAYRSAVDARSWDNFPPIPSATSVVRDGIRDGAEQHGYVCVDLSARAVSGATAADSAFLDYCHLSANGMRVAMAAVATAIRGLVESTPAPRRRRAAARPVTAPPRTDAAVKFMTALYTAHWGAPADIDDPAHARRVREWIDAALEASPDIEAALRAYAATRAMPTGAVLSAEHRRLHAALPELERLTVFDEGLDPDVVAAIGEALAARGRPLAADVEARLIRHHGVARGRVNLIHPRYHWRPLDRYDGDGGFGDGSFGARGGFYRARWPASHFCLVAAGGAGARLQLTARLPRVESPRKSEVVLAVNGAVLGGATLTDRWSRAAFEIAAARLRRGFNRITLAWPALPAEGDAALAQMLVRLEHGLPTDLHPVFGEIAVFRATPAAPV
jgi:hypothetical protein